MALTVACAGSAVLQSAYTVVWVSRKDVAHGDLPAEFLTGLNGITTLNAGIANWGFSPAAPAPTNGTWNPATTYATGNTVASAAYRIESADGTLNQPLVYRSLRPSNLNHSPEAFDGWWTCMTQPPHDAVINKNFRIVPFGYALSPLPTKTTLAAATWEGSLGHSLFWGTLSAPGVPPPGDIVQLIDLYVLLNYLVGTSIIHTLSQPLSHAVVPN